MRRPLRWISHKSTPYCSAPIADGAMTAQTPLPNPYTNPHNHRHQADCGGRGRDARGVPGAAQARQLGQRGNKP